MSYRGMLGISLVALGMAVAAPAMAKMDPPAKAHAAKPADTDPFSDAKLSSYAAARIKIEALNKQYDGMIRAATDKNLVQQEKTIDLTAAIKSEGLTVAEYNQIYTASKADPTLAAKIASKKATTVGNGG